MNEVKKCCADCKTTKTPLWRVGPAGPKSLCNACGIRYRKRRNAMLGLNRGSEKRKEKPATTTPTQKISSGGSGKGGNLSEDLRVKLMDLGKEMVRLQRQRSPMKRRKTNSRNLGEEEQAAFLLMALSCGSVFA
ncbi:GATA transcription factor [Actinidia chinensis var. chinensis]|uniref:GATA transcription factor n=1 Tax=Actinidia chinensis var. chinensis TaxID=1590841 RepID=A0A2R6Q751_ACTCC|nr:GATA transcription factor [Actinidia chinensis var. chinensis]